MKKLFLYLSLFILAFFSGYLLGHEKYKDYHYDYVLEGYKGNTNSDEVISSNYSWGDLEKYVHYSVVHEHVIQDFIKELINRLSY